MAISITGSTLSPRRSLSIALLTVLVIVTGVVVLGTTNSPGRRILPARVARIERPTQTSSLGQVQLDPTTSSVPRSMQASWVIAENERPGTSAWRIPANAPMNIEGYADRVSAQVGDVIALFVSTTARSFRVEAYRIGYYQGFGGRFVWRSAQLRGQVQRAPMRTPGINMIEASWTPSLRVRIGDDWPQGIYMFKLVASNGGQGYVPLTVRDDSSHAALIIQNAVATWQAYNDWGGYSLYHGPDGGFGDRSRIVSFDRPYSERRGSGDFFWLESPVVYLAERLGLDVTYWTDIDLHEHPQLLRNHRALIALGHDEYWSSHMRKGALAARSHGINLAFLGGNDAYRHIRLAASPIGRDRREIDYKVASEDPLYGVDNAEVTSQWREPPLPRPESLLLGGLYQCNPVQADLVVSEPTSWVFAGTGLGADDHIGGAVELEYDRVDGGLPTPASVEILAHSLLTCRGRADHADVTYYTTRGGGGVIDMASQGWDALLTCERPQRTVNCRRGAVRITANILRMFAQGPVGVRHPSKPNLGRFGIRLEHPVHV
jgi:N,N-dimethylformamidase beta subunit-like protein